MIDIPDSIFPTNSTGQALCPKCQKAINDCTCKSYDPTQPKMDLFNPLVSVEKSQRHGKMVTVVSKLPPNESYLKKLAKKIKSKTASGGTFYVQDNYGVIETQGSNKNIILEVLRSEGMVVKS
jgi:translation initiation factor 1